MYRKSSHSANANCVGADAHWATASASQNNGGCVQATWAKSSHTNPNACVEAMWEKSSASYANGDSVEVRYGQCQLVHVRDSKDPDGIIIDYPRDDWDSGRVITFEPVSKSIVPGFLIRARDAKVSAAGQAARDHWYQVTRDGRALWFDQAEVDAWKAGVAGGEFVLDEEAARQ